MGWWWSHHGLLPVPVCSRTEKEKIEKHTLIQVERDLRSQSSTLLRAGPALGCVLLRSEQDAEDREPTGRV